MRQGTGERMRQGTGERMTDSGNWERIAGYGLGNELGNGLIGWWGVCFKFGGQMRAIFTN